VNENENKKRSDGPLVVGLLALILVLFIGIKFVFAALDTAIPDLKTMADDYEARHSTSVSTSAYGSEETPEATAPKFCPHCGDELHESFDWGQFCPWCGKKVE